MSTLNDQIHEGQSETIKHEHKKNQQEIELFDLKKLVQSLRDENKKSVTDLQSSKSELADALSKNQSLLQQVDRFKSLVENLDHSKEELIKRLQNSSKEKKDEESDKAILHNDLQNYKREVIAKD